MFTLGALCSDLMREKYINDVQHYERAKMLSKQPIAVIPELLKIRDELIRRVDSLNLPANSIDTLIDELGGVEKVAELTGRGGRMVRDEKDKTSFRYRKRAGNSSEKFGLSSQEDLVAIDQVNIIEKKKFMDGKKCVAIISDAASTGISLHASAIHESGHRRRVHYTIELPWAADKAIQQLGRTHRSGQRSAPSYITVVSNLGGEWKHNLDKIDNIGASPLNFSRRFDSI